MEIVFNPSYLQLNQAGIRSSHHLESYFSACLELPENSLHLFLFTGLKNKINPKLLDHPSIDQNTKSQLLQVLGNSELIKQNPDYVKKWAEFIIESKLKEYNLPDRWESAMKQIEKLSVVIGFHACVFFEKLSSKLGIIEFPQPGLIYYFFVFNDKIYALFPIDYNSLKNMIEQNSIHQIIPPYQNSHKLTHCGHDFPPLDFKTKGQYNCGVCGENLYRSELPIDYINMNKRIQKPDKYMRYCYRRCKYHPTTYGVIRLNCRCKVCIQCINLQSIRFCPICHQQLNNEDVLNLLIYCQVNCNEKRQVQCQVCNNLDNLFFLQSNLGHPNCNLCVCCWMVAFNKQRPCPICRNPLNI